MGREKKAHLFKNGKGRAGISMGGMGEKGVVGSGYIRGRGGWSGGGGMGWGRAGWGRRDQGEGEG